MSIALALVAHYLIEVVMIFGALVLMTLIWLAGYTTGHREGLHQGENETWDRLNGPALPPLENPDRETP